MGFTVLYALGFALSALAAKCPDFSDYSMEYHAPFSSGAYNLSYMRPAPQCRTFVSSDVDNTVTRLKSIIKDPDLYRLFQNSFPNTLDTAIKWKGHANGSDEELTFVITGDINAMWLRDSANQMQSYLGLLKPSTSSNSIASLYRGVINLQARYILTNPYCNSFQPPKESGIKPAVNGAATGDTVKPPYTNSSVFECKYEIDSLAAFLEVSFDYFNATKDSAFFGKYSWVKAVNQVLTVAEDMMTPTYASNGSVNISPYTFTRMTTRASETLENDGLGNPVQQGTGLVRSAFRPSDDATIWQLFIPGNMMFSRYLDACSEIARHLQGQSDLADRMTILAASIKAAIDTHGIVDSAHGPVYAYEIDGYGSTNMMDDANIPSLLAAPVYGYLDANDQVYQNTRKMLLSTSNPYYMRGPVINAIGGPHDGPGFAWPMASIVRILTSNDDAEISDVLKGIVNSTDGYGLIHESVNAWNVTDWTRQWFSWANGLFGQMILDLEERKPEILSQSFQPSKGNSYSHRH
ncbi:hypothetical protein NA57DRAFT_46897 [Rhizodiscina lignyota]|uniref:Glycoside hydrolase family 125 protein n=1 Tax=Rhizodiscina lignyota TaxID=1504668 RepID=A0A9P4I338_9PEZI|nr:hypothetical protein NA57DRAFT_46897 [Rhizodiscina lignyota]